MSANLEQLKTRVSLVPDLEPAAAPMAEPAPLVAEPKLPEKIDLKPTSRSRSRYVLWAAPALAIVAAGGWGAYWWTVGRFKVSTDDAYVHAHNTTLAAKVPGYLASFVVADNAQVRAGDLIATIDSGDYRLAVDAARGKVASQEATITRIGRQVEASRAAVDQARAQLASADANIVRTEAELTRQRQLAAKDIASRSVLETAQANRDQANATVAGAAAALAAAEANVEVMRVQEHEAVRTLAELRTALLKAERDFGFTEIRAPIGGVIGNRAVQTGDNVQTGQRLASLVPLEAIYVRANFKETQLARLRSGQKVSIKVDSLPGHVIEGVVASVAPASGAVFSLLPPDNATGNFTKIVQRVPVHIRVPLDVAEQGVLRPGMSVVVSVNTKPSAPTRDDGTTTARAALPRIGLALSEED